MCLFIFPKSSICQIENKQNKMFVKQMLGISVSSVNLIVTHIGFQYVGNLGETELWSWIFVYQHVIELRSPYKFDTVFSFAIGHR